MFEFWSLYVVIIFDNNLYYFQSHRNLYSWRLHFCSKHDDQTLSSLTNILRHRIGKYSHDIWTHCNNIWLNIVNIFKHCTTKDEYICSFLITRSGLHIWLWIVWFQIMSDFAFTIITLLFSTSEPLHYLSAYNYFVFLQFILHILIVCLSMTNFFDGFSI